MSIDEKIDTIQPGSVALLGAPFDANSSFLRGAALGPARIRETLHSGASNWSTELGVDLSAATNWSDLGDAHLPGAPGPLEPLRAIAARLAERSVRPLTLGGDHSISAALVEGLARQHGPLTILHLDAHPDLYDALDGSRHSHACPFARIMEAGLAQTLVQVGIRTLNPHQRQQAERFGVEIIAAGALRAGGGERLRQMFAEGGKLCGPIYLSIDLDVLDPAFAPGVSHHEPGGLSTRDVIEVVHALPGPVIGADIVELNSSRDPIGRTAAVAAKLCKEVLGRMAAG